MYKTLIYILFLFATVGASAQALPERRAVRQGNRQYDKGAYDKSLSYYQRALAADSSSFEAGYDLGGAFYKLQQYDKAEKALQPVATDSLQTDTTARAHAYYNLGNAQFQQKKYQQALDSYKASLRLNPADSQAKFNYAYTKYLLDQQNKNGGGGKNNQDKNKDQNKDKQNQNQNGQDKQNQNNQQNKDNQQNNQGDQNGQNQPQQGNPDQQNGQGDKGDKQQQQGQTSPGGISPQEQQQMLDAIQAQEDKTQDKLKKQQAQGVVVPGEKNW